MGQEKPLNLIITGMHRSGTSLTASFLQSMGINLGEKLLQGDQFNLKGYFEDVDFLEFQRSVLQACCRPEEAGWPDWGWTESEWLDRSQFQNYIAEARALINSRSQRSKFWGWKDPRTSLMLDFWHQLLPEARYLFVYRFPWDVADSIFRINSPTFSQHPDYILKIWAFYNRHILDFYSQNQDQCILFNLNSFIQSPEQFLELLEGKLGVQIKEGWKTTLFQDIYAPELLKNLELSSPVVQLLQHTAPQYFSLLAELDQAADIPSNFSSSLLEGNPSDIESLPLVLHYQSLLKDENKQAESKQTEIPTVNELPLVSICIPTYNGEDFIAEALDSALSQTYPQIEIIISDDGSTDRTVEIARSLQENSSVHFSIIPHERYGLAQNWNFCISQAKGKYIKFLFQDDLLENDCVEELVNLAEQDNEVGLVFSTRRIFFSGGADSQENCLELYQKILDVHKGWSNLKDIQSGQELLEDFNLFQASINKVGEPSVVLLRKEVFDRLGLFDSKFYQLTDIDMWLRIMSHYKIGFIEKPLSSLRIHPQQQSNQNKIDREVALLDTLNFYHKILNNFCYNTIPAKSKHQAFREYTILKEEYCKERGLIKYSATESSEISISVVIPCFNQGEFILDAIASVETCNQSIYEIIIINDGSTDALTQQILSFLENKGYLIIHQSNQGLAKARNIGIQIARGRYILPLDADNKIRSDYITKGIEVLEQFPEVGVVYGDAELFGETTALWKIPDFDLNRLLKENYIDACAVIRKAVWQDCGGYDPEMPLQGYEDWDFWLSAVEKGWQFYHIPEVLFDYRVRSDSMVTLCKIPENHQKLVRYIQEKHINLYNDNLELKRPKIQPKASLIQINLQEDSELSSPNCINYPVIEPVDEEINRPFWSVMIPTYNGANHLKETLKSILYQDCDRHEMQIEVVDDCSTRDDIEAIVREIGQERVSFYRQPKNIGLSANWNTCIRRARGYWVHILHQDDLIMPGFYSRLRESIEQNSMIGAAFCRHAFIDEKGDRLFLSPLERDTPGILSFWLERLAVEQRIQCPAIVVRRSIYEELGGFHPELLYALDWEMWKRIAAHYSFWYEPQILAAYRLRHSSSESSRLMKSGENVADLKKSIEISQAYLPEIIASELSNKAREHWALSAFDTAHRMLSAGDAKAAIAQIREGLKCSSTAKVTNSLAYLLFQSPESEAFLAALSNRTEPSKTDGNSLSTTNPRQARSQLAEQILSLSADRLESMYLGELGKEYRTLLNTNIKNELLTDTEQEFIEELSANVARGLERPQAVNYLLAALLYRWGYQLPLHYDLSRIPLWFLNDYLGYVFASPPYFTGGEEPDSYYYYLQKWINYIYENIFQNPDSLFWQKIALFFAINTNFKPSYLTAVNLKTIYTQRAAILEFGLKAHGHQIDYVFPRRLGNRNKIRLGVLSYSFQPQAETFAMLPIFEDLNPQQFEIILYAFNFQQIPLEEYVSRCADRLVQLPNDLRSQAQTIRADELDILLIGTSVTADNNAIALLSLHRLARVQVTGFADRVTTGMRNIDYFISGKLAESARELGQYYREKVIALEGTGFCFSYPATQNPTIKTDRKSLGIPEKAVVFISAADFYKIIPDIQETWAKIVSAVPKSVLVLLPFRPHRGNSDPQMPFINQMRAAFAKYGVANSRLLVLAALPNRADVKEVLKIGDVYLDTYPYVGSASLVEPLEVGLPLVVREGKFLRSVTAAAMLRSLQIPELITDSEQAYIKNAIALGTNPELRQLYHQGIQQKMQSKPDFLDSSFYCTQLETLFSVLASATHPPENKFSS